MIKKMGGWACDHADGMFTRGRELEFRELSAKGAASRGVKRPAVSVDRAPIDPPPRAPSKGKTAGIPFRQDRAPVPLPLTTGIDLEGIAKAVARRVYLIARARSCCAFVFVRDGRVYVLSEESPMAHRWAIQYTAEWVGCYGGLIDIAGLMGDMEGMLPRR